MAGTITAEMSKTPGVSGWPRFPTVYEINTCTWLFDLSRNYQRDINLSSVPPNEWDALAAYGFDAVWFMGVWERSPEGISIANRNAILLDSFRKALPDFSLADNIGSPYCIRRYIVDELLGGPKGLATARQELAKRGIRLVLDFVPNHVAPDHPWTTEHPEYFIHGSVEDLNREPSSYIQVKTNVYACGRDPFFPAWPEVLQLNAFDPDLRRAASQTVASITKQCDGIRCDMAMLFLNPVFARTWGDRAGPVPATEYWSELISSIKNENADFLFIAEAYWDLEWQLQQLGFDFCYDKKLCDRLEHGNAESVRLHLCAEFAYQEKLVRFIENHDEPRAAATFPPAKQRAAALAAVTLPGMKLLHEGQMQGRKVRPPVFLRRRADEPPDLELEAFYRQLLDAIKHSDFHIGQWTLCTRTGWPDNSTFQNLLAWSWNCDDRYLVVVNLSDYKGQGRVGLPWDELRTGHWQLTDLLSGSTYERDGNEMLSPGLYVELGPWGCHLFRCACKTSP